MKKQLIVAVFAFSIVSFGSAFADYCTNEELLTDPTCHASCGTAIQNVYISSTPPANNTLCLNGIAATAPQRNTTELFWYWTCESVRGGSDASCQTAQADGTPGNQETLGEDGQPLEEGIECVNTTFTEAPLLCDINDPDLAGICYHPAADATFIITKEKVGIKNMDPEYDLDVNGTIRAEQILILSDERAKEHIAIITDALEKIRAINGYTFTRGKSGIKDMGVLAQEIEKSFAYAVQTDNQGIKTVQYTALIAPLTEAIKELNSIIDTQLQQALEQADHIGSLEKACK